MEISSGVRVSHPPTDAIIVFRWVSCSRKAVQKVLKPPLMVFIEQTEGLLPWPAFTFFLFLSYKLLAVVTALQPSQHKSELPTECSFIVFSLTSLICNCFWHSLAKREGHLAPTMYLFPTFFINSSSIFKIIFVWHLNCSSLTAAYSCKPSAGGLGRRREGSSRMIITNDWRRQMEDNWKGHAEKVAPKYRHLAL